jgi:hypothetical protein
MMEIDEYLAQVAGIADNMNRQLEGFELYVASLKGTCARAEACVAFRHALATPAELSSVAGYLEVGFFADADPERQKAWWLFLFDITRMAENVALERVCRKRGRGSTLRGARKIEPPVVLEEGRQGDGRGVGI